MADDICPTLHLKKTETYRKLTLVSLEERGPHPQ